MWEIALLVIAAAFLILVLFTIPALLQVRDSAKELEFTLRESREALRKVREAAEGAEMVVRRGGEMLNGAERALTAVNRTLGRRGSQALVRMLTTALEVFPLVVAARRLFVKQGKEE